MVADDAKAVVDGGCDERIGTPTRNFKLGLAPWPGTSRTRTHLLLQRHLRRRDGPRILLSLAKLYHHRLDKPPRREDELEQQSDR